MKRASMFRRGDGAGGEVTARLVTPDGTVIEIVPVDQSGPATPFDLAAATPLPAAAESVSERRRVVATALLAVSGWVALLSFALPAGSALRFVITSGFTFVCPGAALVLLAGLRDPLEHAVYAVAASAAMAAIVSMVFVMVRHGNAVATLDVLAVWTTIAALVHHHLDAAAVTEPGVVTDRVPVLLYHSVSDAPAPWIAPFNVTPAQFERHLDLVVASGRAPMTLSEYADSISTGFVGRPPVVITFDDGFADFVTTAGPALAARDLPSTIYVSTGSLRDGARRPAGAVASTVLPDAAMLSWDQLGLLASFGAEVGAHSHSHPQLDTLPAPLAVDEIETSRSLLEDALGGPVRSFAYPHGYSSPAVRAAVVAAGFASAAGVRNRFSSPSDDRYNIARLMVPTDVTDETIAAWLDGRGAPEASSLERPKSALWRAARRARAAAR